MESPRCEACGQAFKDRKNLLQHTRTVHDNVAVACKYCGKTFTRINNRDAHEYKCKSATVSTPMNISHPAATTSTAPSKTTTTGPSTTTTERTPDPLLTPGSSDVRLTPTASKKEAPRCEACGQAFKDRKNLLQHTRTVHDNVAVACKYCGKTFTRKQNRNAHEYKCKSATVSSQMDISHPAATTSTAPSKTTTTGSSTTTTERTPDSLLTPGSSDVPLTPTASTKEASSSEHMCDICEKTFPHRRTWLRHIRTIHETDQSSIYVCETCGKSFSHVFNLKQHINSVHFTVRIPCSKCSKTFTRNSNRIEHENKCLGSVTYNCNFCAESFPTFNRLRFHNKIKHGKRPAETQCNPAKRQKLEAESRLSSKHDPISRPSSIPRSKPSHGPSSEPRPGPSSYKCGKCPARFESRAELHAHTMSDHQQVGGGELQTRPFADETAPWVGINGEVDEGMRNCYNTNSPLILTPNAPGKIESTYNVPMHPDMTVNDLEQSLLEIFNSQTRAFKINLSFGFIMRHIETNQYRYFRPYGNQSVFDEPILISNMSDLRRVVAKLAELDPFKEMSKARPNTKWRLVLLTNLRYKLFNTDFTLGSHKIHLPEHIKHNHSIVPLDKDPVNFHEYSDNLCAFRSLCLHKYGSVDHTKVLDLFRQWDRVEDPECFEGIYFSELLNFEQCFEVNIHVYELEKDGVAYPVFKSPDRYAETMYVNNFGNHLSYITDFQKYAKKYRCILCDKLFNQVCHFKRHEKNCDHKTKFVYPGGFHKPSNTIFDELEMQGIFVPTEQRLFEWFAVYDFESLLRKVDDPAGEKLIYTQEHVPISVSLCSNVTDFDQPRCIIDDDLDAMLSQMVEYLHRIRDRCSVLASEKWGWVLKELEYRMLECGKDIEFWENDEMPVEDGEMIVEDGDIIVEDGETDVEVGECETIEGGLSEGDESERKLLRRLYGQMLGYMNTLPVLGFNSSRYDIPLVLTGLAGHLRLENQKYGFTVKKANSYACIQTDAFKFLDIKDFLAPGTSYTKFLKAYKVEETKGYFPYEWFDDVSKLDYTSLPPKESFYSSLKDENISDENYEYCLNVWQERGMRTFRDFLSWYNDLDVGPFVTAVRRLQSFYFENNIDVLKTAISVPGIARQMLFQAARKEGAEFALFDKSNKDLYETISDNIVGGPSLIFTRHHEAGETLIRGDKPCQRIVGFDANALYLWAIGQPMPEGIFVRRLAEKGFKPDYRDHHQQAFHWLNYLNKYEAKDICHYRNNGKEKRVGAYPVDGFDARENTVYQFHGCYFHGHQCDLTEKIKDEKWCQRRQANYDKTMATTQYIRSKGFAVVEMWECEFKRFRENHPRIYGMINDSRPHFAQRNRGKVTESKILKSVRDGDLFGMVEVDIEVPEQWGQDFKDRMSMPPREYFSEMCPLFANMDIPFDIIGEHMQAHALAHGLSQRPRRLLVSGLKARQILLATPLLKWYLEHGLIVTKIYQVVEFRKNVCFEKFVDEVSDARREGDASPDLAIIADTMKLIGNSAYGSMIMDKTRHRKIDYKRGENNACLAVNTPEFRQLTCLDEGNEYYEIELAKRVIKLDLPIQLGYFILQYAKLKMLQFYFDFMDTYVARSDFEYIEMDTDSAYMAISASCLDDIIKPDHRDKFQRGLSDMCDDSHNSPENRWLPRTCCSKHAKFDKRTPGLFKKEFEGHEMVGLCSKTYAVSGDTETKFSSKGISKRFVQQPMAIYKDVLTTQNSHSGMNKGFRVKDHKMFSYRQTRCGFSYFYVKRKILDDGIHSVPLDLVLCPSKRKKEND